MLVETFDWDRIRIFRAVAELGSMSAAAEQMGGSVPTISRRISELEHAFRTELILRSTRGVDLTSAGHALLRHANLIADIVSAAHDDVAGSDKPDEGSIHIVTGDGLGPYWIAPRLADFHRLYPRITVRLTISDDVPDLLNNEADISVQCERPTRSDLIARRIGVLHYLCFASEAYLDRHGRPTALTDFGRHRCLIHGGYVRQAEKWAAEADPLRQLVAFALVTNSAAVMLADCVAGGGIAVLPSYIGETHPALVPLDLPRLAPIEFWLTYSERMRRLERGQVVLDWLKQAFAPSSAPWFRQRFVHPRSVTSGA
ncbi:LysR family transcriptional regulator [Hyphomonas johnsonii]|uniref:LysR family transcriptional regulator n=1 Tax=Hyphomonas johnsonii MHS-2 TaxID=1280950 RepID=A0A059FUH2_9PROT|nr:LysR family transcriptional regulator [Hyphomonas johnsonii]KCZ94324.1 LysR family transcriptional regulator [Hyphomonas johnsonii MHS-2]